MRGVSRIVIAGRTGWWPPAELLLVPLLVLLLVNALTTKAALTPNQVDVIAYWHHAQAVASGGLPYRDFAFEYPPLALLSMAAPFLAWPFSAPDLDTYRWLFTAWECLLLGGLVLVTARIAGHTGTEDGADPRHAVRVAATRLVVLTLVTAPSLAWRYDLLPALLAASALLLAIEGRAAWSGILLGLSILAKVYPLFLIPAVAAAWVAPIQWRRLATFGIGLAGAVAIALLPLLALVGPDAWSFIAYQADRGLQLETLPAGVMLLLSAIAGGNGVPLTYAYGSVQVAGSAADAYLAIQLVLTLASFAVLAAIGLTAVRREQRATGGVQPRTVLTLATACVLLLLVTGKVFSVQYVVWLLPMAAFLSRRQFWLAVVIGALSIGIHPLFYQQLINRDPGVVVLLNARNGLVLGLLIWVLAHLLRSDRPRHSRWAVASDRHRGAHGGRVRRISGEPTGDRLHRPRRRGERRRTARVGGGTRGAAGQ